MSPLKESNSAYLCHTEVLPSSSHRCRSRVSRRCHAHSPGTANTHRTVGPASHTYTYKPQTEHEQECVCVCVCDISAQVSLNWIYTIEHIYQTAVKPITSCQLSMIFHFLFIYTFEKSSIPTEILAILIVSHIAHLRYTSKFKRRKSECHRDRSVNFFPVADTGHDLCLFSNLR